MSGDKQANGYTPPVLTPDMVLGWFTDAHAQIGSSLTAGMVVPMVNACTKFIGDQNQAQRLFPYLGPTRSGMDHVGNARELLLKSLSQLEKAIEIFDSIPGEYRGDIAVAPMAARDSIKAAKNALGSYAPIKQGRRENHLNAVAIDHLCWSVAEILQSAGWAEHSIARDEGVVTSVVAQAMTWLTGKEHKSEAIGRAARRNQRVPRRSFIKTG